MMNGYERATKEIVPAARLMLARELKYKYNMTESNIAAILGVAQAAVSKYLNGKYSDAVDRISKQIDTSQLDRYVESIANGNHKEIKRYICAICIKMNEFGCQLSAVGPEASQ